jgi:hypothetical protein
MVCMGDEVKDRFVVAHEKANGGWELWGFNETWWIGGHGTFGAHEVGLLWTQAPFFIDCPLLWNNLKSTKPTTQY